MEEHDPRPENKPAGNMPPPRPPRGTGVSLGPESDGPDKNWRATITKVAEGEGKFIRDSGGRNHYGHVKVKVEPNGRGKGVEIVSQVAVSAIPAEYTRSVTKGVREALNGGIVIGRPAVDGCRVVDIIVRVVDGSFHQTDSNELAFTMAGIFATKDALKKAAPIVIE